MIGLYYKHTIHCVTIKNPYHFSNKVLSQTPFKPFKTHKTKIVPLIKLERKVPPFSLFPVHFPFVFLDLLEK